jgi:drug/metabolite transporter (DMT)-like permease
VTQTITDSLLYLPIADATVITFLAPSVAGYACYLLYHEPFTRTEQGAGLLAFLGVILIARPTSFFSSSSHADDSQAPSNSTSAFTPQEPTPVQHLSAIAVALLGVLGAGGTYTILRRIGSRAHPLISINYFAVFCTFISTLALLLGPHVGHPDWHFQLPHTGRQWLLLCFLGACGFIMQILLTAGLAHGATPRVEEEEAPQSSATRPKGGNRATNMVYTNMLWAMLFDRWIFGATPGWWSVLGSALILSSAAWVAVSKDAPVKTADRPANRGERGRFLGEEEEDEGMEESRRSVEDEDIEMGRLE